MTEFEGSVWVVQNEDKVFCICITERNKNKIQALDEKGNKIRIAEDKLLWQHPTQVRKLEEWPNKLSTIHSAVEMLTRDIDVSLLWTSALELQVSEMDDLADLYFGGEITTEHFMAIWQVLAKDRLYFKRRGKIWEARSLEQVEELKVQRRREQLQAQEQTLATTWLQQVSKSLPQEDSEEFKILEVVKDILPFVERLEAWLRGDADKFVEELATRIATPMKLNPRELVFEVLVKIGRFPSDAEREIIVAGLRPEFSTVVLEAAQGVQFWQPSVQQPVLNLLFSIDDEETREVDDALSIEREGEQWKIMIAIADPTRVVHRGDVLDREAMRRGTTIYLPTQTILMLPERISCHIASLTAQEVRSSIVVCAWIDDQGHLLGSSISREAIQVLRRLHYNDADALLAHPSQEQMAQRLHELLTCAKQLQARRLAEGAFNLQRPEYKVSIHDGDIHITLIDKDSPSRFLVAEMMILANYIAAHYAQRHQVPIIYRTQDPPLEPITQEMLDHPLSFHRVRKLLRASSLSLHPSGHSGLGLPVYTQLTSPLRRFADLVMQRQLFDHLSGETLPYDQEELFKVLATAERTAREARMLEGESKRRWFMRYLKQSWGSQPLEVLVVEAVKMGYKVEILPWGVEAFLGTSKELVAGEIVSAKIDKIRIKANTARLKLI